MLVLDGPHACSGLFVGGDDKLVPLLDVLLEILFPERYIVAEITFLRNSVQGVYKDWIKINKAPERKIFYQKGLIRKH